jgi:hypothetical protein
MIKNAPPSVVGSALAAEISQRVLDRALAKGPRRIVVGLEEPEDRRAAERRRRPGQPEREDLRVEAARHAAWALSEL